ncbi:MAG: cache domain-containing protein [Campylobacterota bacterium]|nr:cache domain-containing protein [Campylobacterota bacterium]
MKESKKRFEIVHHFNHMSLYAILLLLLVLFASLFFFLKQDNKTRLISLSDQVVENFRAGLDKEMVDLLSFSMALSEDGELKNALSQEDESKGYKILSNISNRFKKHTHLKSLRLQVLTPDFFIFARSWNEGFEGMPIWWFRDDLDRDGQNNEPKVGMETGRLLTFKTTVPIRSGDKILGYLEVITFIDEFSTKLRQRGIELFALMDEKYLKQAELMRDFPLLHGYVVSNQNFNKQLIDKVEILDWEVLLAKNHVYEDDILYVYEPMYNGKKKQIGVYLLAITKDMLKKYEKENQSISFFTQFSNEDIENVVDAWENPYGSFRTKFDKDLIELLPKLEQEDKLILEAEAHTMLNSYSKSELIDIVLENSHKEKKIGEIK